MAISLVQTLNDAKTTGSTSYTSVAFGSAVTAGNIIIAGITTDMGVTGTVTAVTDSLGNTYTKVTNLTDGAASKIATADLWYAQNITGGTPTLTVTSSATAKFGLIAREYSGLDTSAPFDKFASANDGGTANAAPASGSTATTTSANELIIGFGASADSNNTYTAGSGFANAVTRKVGTSVDAGMEDKTVSSTGTQAANFTITNVSNWAMIVATFKAPDVLSSDAFAFTLTSGGGSTITKTQPAIARIATTPTKTQPAIARVANVKTKTQPAVARVANVRTKTQPAIARVANIRTLTQTATAYITNTGYIGITADNSSTGSSSTDKKAASYHIAGSTGIADTMVIRAWMDSGMTSSVRGFIYADSAGAPGALLAVTGDISISNNAEAAQTLTFAGANRITLTGGTGYWIGFHWSDPGALNFNFSRANLTNKRVEGTETFSDGTSDPFGTPTTLVGPIDAYITLATVLTKTQPAIARVAKTLTKTQTATARITVPVYLLTDNFNDNSMDVTKWSSYATSASVSETSSQLQIVTSTTATGYAGYSSVYGYSLLGSKAQVHVVQPTNAGIGNAEGYMELVDGADSTNAILMDKGGDNLYFIVRTAGVDSTTSITWNGVDHVYWSVEESGGNILFKTSPDGATWTTRRTVANPTWPLTQVHPGLAAGTWAITTGGGTVIYDDFNLVSGTIITKTQTAVARVATNITKTQPATARIQRAVTKTQPATARIAQNYTKTQPAISRVANNITKTQPAVARVARNLTKTQTAIADIAKSVTKTQPAISRIANVKTKTQPAISRLSQNYTKTQPSISRIAKSVTKTQPAVAAIQGQATKTQTAIAKIVQVSSYTKTQTATARIRQTVTATQPAIATIAKSVTKTQPVNARVSITVTKTQPAIARTSNTRTRTQPATARIITATIVNTRMFLEYF